MGRKAEEKRKNCGSCNKSLRRIDQYYRNGGYYCNKNCFKNYCKKQEQQAEG